MKPAIAIPTHISGIIFLENLLRSIGEYNKYDIIIVINEFKKDDEEKFYGVINKFKRLNIKLLRMDGTAGEYAAIYAAYNMTDYTDIFVVGHSCEVLDVKLFDIVFEECRGKSVAISYLPVRKPLLVWTSWLGKYRRCILDKMEVSYYCPKNLYEVTIAESLFTDKYNRIDKNTICLFPEFVDTNSFADKFGKKVMKISNEYLIKWKSHWHPEMVIKKMKSMGKSLPTEQEIIEYVNKFS